MTTRCGRYTVVFEAPFESLQMITVTAPNPKLAIERARRDLRGRVGQMRSMAYQVKNSPKRV